jgi:predicted ATPase/class 3 adenylate cyclase
VGPELPAGTVTFLFTDIEGSTRLLHELGPDDYANALAEHRRVLRAMFAEYGGVEVDTQGDAFFVAFPTAPGALAAAAGATEALGEGPIRIRIGLHTGTPLRTGEGYVGSDVHRAARIAAAAHGGQVVVSSSTHALVPGEGWRLHDLGEHRLKDLAAPERLWQLGEGRFPPLKSLYRANLPVPQTAFLGRASEVAAVSELLVRADVRLLTLTGSGGTGKTRLALQAAGEVAEAFPDGITWLALAPLRDASHVVPTLADALDVEADEERPPAEAVAAALAGKRALLLLDNAEHLLPELTDALAPVRSIPGPTLLVTSRERLRLQGERVYPVPTLAKDDAVHMFTVLARALEPSFVPTGAVAELCARLDFLPLAVELAAARTPLFSPEQLLQRVGQHLDLLRGGRDTDPRQLTLRATIAWSCDLLPAAEQELFHRLAIFAGGCAYEAAEAICDADPDMMQSLVDKSLVRRRGAHSGPRYWMLETVREYALERLARSSEYGELRARHAEWYAALGVQLFRPVRLLDPAATASMEDELPNLRAGLAFAIEGRDAAIAADYLVALSYRWMSSGRGHEAAAAAAAWLRLDVNAVEPTRRLLAFGWAGEIVKWTGDQARAADLKQKAVTLARAHQREEVHGVPVRGVLAGALSGLSSIELNRGRFDVAERHATEALAIRREIAEPSGIANATEALAEIAYARREFVRARELLTAASSGWFDAGWAIAGACMLTRVAECELLLGHLEDARKSLSGAARELLAQPLDCVALSYLAVVGAMLHCARDPATAAELVGLADELVRDAVIGVRNRYEVSTQEAFLAGVRTALGAEDYEAALERGRALDPVGTLSRLLVDSHA